MTVGKEKTTIDFTPILKRELRKHSIVGLIYLYLFLDPRIFAAGFPSWGIWLLFGILIIVELIYEWISLGIFGIKQEVRVEK